MTAPIDLAPRLLRFPDSANSALAIAREELPRLYADSDRQVDGLLIELAQTRFYLGRALAELPADTLPLAHDAVETLGEQLDRTLAEWQVRVDDRSGQRWEVEWAEICEVRGHRQNNDIPHAVVAFTERPLIWRGNRLLSKGIITLEGPRQG